MDSQNVIVQFAQKHPSLIQMPVSRLNLISALETFASKANIHYTIYGKEGFTESVSRKLIEEKLEEYCQEKGKQAELCSFLEYLTGQAQVISFAKGYVSGSISDAEVTGEDAADSGTNHQQLNSQEDEGMSQIEKNQLQQLINEVSQTNLKKIAQKVVEEVQQAEICRTRHDTPQSKSSHMNTQQSSYGRTKRRNTEDANISRLRQLYEFYTKKQYKCDAQTFDDMQKNIQKMDLTTWMLFNKDSNTTSIIGKDQMHGIFKKFCELHSLTFQSFHRAMLEVLEKIHPGNIENGWKMLGVESTRSVGKRMSRLGVPSYIYQASHFTKEHLSEQHPPPAKSALPQLVDINTILVSTPAKPKRPNPNNKITLQKLAQMKVKPDFPLPDPEPQDQIYLKSYRLENNENTPLKNTYKMRHNKQNKAAKQLQTGILSRIDQRIMQMSRKL